MSSDILDSQYGFLKSLKIDGTPYLDSKKEWDIIHRRMLEMKLPFHNKLKKLHCKMSVRQFYNWILSLTSEEFDIYRSVSSRQYLVLSMERRNNSKTLQESKKYVDKLYKKYLNEDIEKGIEFEKESMMTNEEYEKYMKKVFKKFERISKLND